VGEIGVHKGRLFILLQLLTRANEKSFAIDVFSEQHLNVDRSGCGDRTEFIQNLQRWAGPTGSPEIFQMSSLDVRAADVIARVGQSRLVSIDGGHTEECAFNDLKLTEDVLAPNGVAILDDYFNQAYPGVATGVARYLSAPNAQLRPFAVTPNKVYLARETTHALYRAEMRRIEGIYFDKNASMHGTPVDIYNCQRRTITVVL
jgi:hypothetical protein